jgi:homoserine dehydrogenase
VQGRAVDTTVRSSCIRACPLETVVSTIAASSSTLRIGLLGLGNVGSAVARLTRGCAAPLRARGLAPVVTSALVRSAARARPAAAFVARLTTDADAFFAEPVDVVVEALGGVEPACALVTRALESGVPVVTANKSLVAARGDELFALARRSGTALRFEAACVAGIPFLGTFERRPLAARVRGVTGILNGTSNAIVTALESGATFDAALADAQRRGFAEPDPRADITGADATQKLAILVRLYAHLVVDPDEVPARGIDALRLGDLEAARDVGGRIRPIAYATWNGDTVRAFVAPAFLPSAHPLAGVSHATNGVLLDAEGGAQCYTGPGAGPDVTAATLLDDVAEIATEKRVRTPAALKTRPARRIERPETAWFVRVDGSAPAGQIADLLGSYGTWCARVATSAGRVHALTFPAPAERMDAAVSAIAHATGTRPLALPALTTEAAC